MKVNSKNYDAALRLRTRLNKAIESAENAKNAKTDAVFATRSSKVTDIAGRLQHLANHTALYWDSVSSDAANRAYRLRVTADTARVELLRFSK